MVSLENSIFDLFLILQGGMLSGGLPGLQAKVCLQCCFCCLEIHLFDHVLSFLQGLALQKVPKIKFIIIIGGAMFRSTEVVEDAYSPSIDTPSLHFLGKI